MSERDHTPGPWRCERIEEPLPGAGTTLKICGADWPGGGLIGTVNLCRGADAYANAALIESAPDLLDALEAVLGRLRWDDHLEGWVPNDLPGEKRITGKAYRAARDAICHLVDELGSFTLEELVESRDLPNSQAALALRFLREHGLVETCHPRRSRRVEGSIHLSAMTCWHGLREGGTRIPSGPGDRDDEE